MRLKLTTATIAFMAIVTGLLGPSPVGASPVSTHIALSCGGSFTINVSAPDRVAPDATSTVQIEIAIGEFFGIPAPYSGTITAQYRFSASNATPGIFTLTTPTTHFNVGDFVSTISFDQRLTAAGPAGTLISIQFLFFNYTIAPDSGGAFSVACQPTATAVVGTIPINLFTPQSKADCKKNGWRDVADAAGMPFSNQGRCVRTTVGAPKT